MILVESAVSELAFLSSSRTCCSRSSIWALLTLPSRIWAIATEVSTF